MQNAFLEIKTSIYHFTKQTFVKKKLHSAKKIPNQRYVGLPFTLLQAKKTKEEETRILVFLFLRSRQRARRTDYTPETSGSWMVLESNFKIFFEIAQFVGPKKVGFSAKILY